MGTLVPIGPYFATTQTDGTPSPCFITAQSFGLVIGSSLRQSLWRQTRAPILGENFLK